MVRKVHSISALAVELDRDRRTIAKALGGVRPDGELPSGQPGWFTATAIQALRRIERPALVRRAPRVGILAVIADRLDAQEAGEMVTLPIAEAAAALGVSTETIDLWTRAGMPRTEAGVCLAHAAEWLAMVGALIDRAGDHELAGRLGLPSRDAA